MISMNPLQVRMLSFVMFAVFCATLTYWIVVLSARPPAPPSAAAVAPSVSLDAATTLFGGKLTRDVDRSIKLSGILSLNEGAAAIVAVGDGPPHAISLGGKLGDNGKLAEVRTRSIVVDRNGVRSEIFLPPNTSGGPTIYVR
jgi:general secretion pathway protein C